MHACTGCSMARGYRKGIPRRTENRAQGKLGRVFVDLSGCKDVASLRAGPAERLFYTVGAISHQQKRVRP